MNILLINHYAGSPFYGMEYRPYYFAREWVRNSHNVTIVSASYSHLRSEQPSVERSFVEENVDGIRYVWLKTPPYAGNGFGRIKNMLTFLFELYRHMDRLAGEFVPDAVIASSTYPLDIYPARRLAQKYKAKLVFEVHDLWPLSPMELGKMSPYHPFIMVMQAAENYAYRHADKVVSLLPKAKEHMVSHGMAKEKFVYIPNGVCLEDWQEINNHKIPTGGERKFIESLKNQGYFVIGYAGSHGIANALDYLVEAIRQVQVNEAKIAVVCIGEGAVKKRLQKWVARAGITNMYFFPVVPKHVLQGLLPMFDALYIGWNKSALYRFGISPNKLFDYMMAARPILHAVTAGNDLVAEAGCGLSVPAEDVSAITAAMIEMKNLSSEVRAEMGARGRAYVIRRHNNQMLAEKFIETVFVEHSPKIS